MYSRRRLATLLGMEMWQLNRAERDGLIPAPATRGCWTAKQAAVLLPRAAELAACAAAVPDLGAYRAALILSDRLGVRITQDGVRELARRGLIATAGEYKGNQLYSGTALAAFADPAAAADAQRAGALYTTPAAVAYMKIRAADFKRLAMFGYIRPAEYVPFAWGTARSAWGTAPLYRAADLDAFLARPDIDWAAVRSTPKNKRTPLYDLTEPDMVLRALAAL